MTSQDRYRTGAQSFSFREFDFEGSIQCLKDLGLSYMEYCGVHFPPDAGHEDLAKVKARLAAEGIQVVCYGVEGFPANEAVCRKKFEFAKALGVEFLTADPEPESFDMLDKLVDEFGVKVAIHNHGPKARYDKVQDTLRAIRDHSPLIGACVDTGHVIRSGEVPHEVIGQLGSRCLTLHLKDWAIGGEEQILGQGAIDLIGVARALKSVAFDGPIVMEYENSPKNPVPEMHIGFENWRLACAKV